MAEPAHGDASVGLFVFRQFPYGFRLCSCVAKYVDEVKHHDIEVFVLYFVKLRHKLFRRGRIVYFCIRERVLAPVSFYLCSYQRLFVEVLPLLFVLVYP